MRPFTKLTLVVLFALLAVAGVIQLVLANRDTERFPGPVPGTPLPTVTASR